ncbi:nicotinamide riboside transporter PnuC [Dysgonomonas sp. 520]|uniref:nicotinamide riboside transporter PnuC n=1 Tax=Dysgonomonas sp. 520 TaxID=2302931 RepID=UPI0013D04601|nr:nicotinamide riboside transporter PnuC [Dysgonomonas sp. 520]NDW09050.1 nicotinamide riboside transporter PnuC [Dysgonomonas sp. 520]
MEFIQTHWQEITGAILGLIYIYYEYKADIKMWPTGILMSIFYVYVFVVSQFYAFAGIYIYYIGAQIYGWHKWSRGTKSEEPLVRTPRKLYLPLSITAIILFLILLYVLLHFGGSEVAWADAFLTALGIVAIWMLAQKYVEQWLPLIVSNFASIFIFAWQGLYPTSIMYAAYSVISIFGYLNWMKMAREAKEK